MFQKYTQLREMFHQGLFANFHFMTNNNKPSRQEMINTIYEKIADKILSFGCKIIVKNKYGYEIDFVVEKLKITKIMD